MSKKKRDVNEWELTNSGAGAALSEAVTKNGFARLVVLYKAAIRIASVRSRSVGSAVLIVILLAQVLFVGPVRVTKAKGNSPATVSSPPPEPYIVGGSNTTTLSLITLAVNYLSVISNSFASPKMPEGLVLAESAKPKPGLITSALSFLRGFSPSSKAVSTTVQPAPLPSPTPVPGSVSYDFDGDYKADIGRWHSSGTEFKVKKSGGGTDITVTIGSSSSKSTPGDFDGDGKMDVAVFTAGTWTVKPSTGGSVYTFSWGTTGDIPVVGNYDGDAYSDMAIYRPSTGTWWVAKSSGGYTSYALGNSTDIPIAGDYDGDGKADYAVYRPSTGVWYIQGSTAGSLGATWGNSTDVPVHGDFDGDGKDDPTVYRPSTGTWYVLKSSTSYATYTSQVWGNYADQPTPADYDGDGKTDYSIWRETTGQWYTLKSGGGDTTETLGVPGDVAIPSSYTKQVGGTATTDEIAEARLSPKNATGGTNLYSQNFSWGMSLVGLPGRSGMDAGLGIGYNSLVWTKVGSEMIFDTDTSNAGPGFHFGLPVIEPIYYNGTTTKWSYMMISPTGARTEFRQTAVSATYETADSSYTQLVTNVAGSPNDPEDPVEDVTITVRTTDGSQMSYSWVMGAYRCNQIMDRNGNKITYAYDYAGHLTTMTDTLSRLITVNYDETTGLPTTITQTWKGTNGSGSNTTHTWATLSYTTKTVDTDFNSSLGVYGPPDDTSITVLDKITYPDGSFTKFEYNGYLQVKKISNVAADSTSHVLNYVEPNLASPSSGQTDCPRFTSTNTWVENFNFVSSTATAVTVTNTAPSSSSFSGPNGSETTSVVKVGMTGDPDNHYTRIHYAPSGYKEGLTLATEDCTDTGSSCGTRVRWTWNEWEQDRVGPTDFSYIQNPRVIDSRVGDGTNTKRSATEYYKDPGFDPEDDNVALYGLVDKVMVYDTNLTTVLKTQKTTYNLDSAYTSRRIIGLPAETDLWEGTTSGTLMSKVTYAYDYDDDFGVSGMSQNISPTQHDGTNYGASFSVGRGNLTSTTRWDVNYPTTSGSAVTSTILYNTAGSPVAKTDPLSHTVKIAYADSYNSSPGVSTYAYPTTLTDQDGHSSTVTYRYDIGANVEATSPAPAGQTYGKTSKRLFDSIGRLERQSIYVNTTERAYTRYEYPTNGVQTQSYTPVIDADGDGNIAEDEVYSESWLDGAGRVRGSRTEHPGSTGGWTASQTEYDILGRVKRQSVPTEVSVASPYDPVHWTAAGDDSGGFVYSSQYYDWKGRTVRTVPAGSNGSDGKDTLISYDGCGCAGGQVMTIEGESVPRNDTSGDARRKQKVYADILGRNVKTETFGWDGSTVYTTVINTFNARDQITNTRQYAGTTSSSTHEDVTMTYDGHGRMATRHYPIEDSGTYTSWAYNADDSIEQVIDPRGAITDFTYNYRGLTTQVSYTPPSGYPPEDSPAYMEIPDTPTVNYTYDNLGNRTEMTDGLGTVDYAYDPLSRLESETRYFTHDDLEDAPLEGSTQAFKISYTYNLSGGLTSYTDPYGDTITNTHDKLGRLTQVDGSSYGTDAQATTHYADEIKYRAWGATKELKYKTDDHALVQLAYDGSKRISAYEVDSSLASGGILKKSTFTYNADSSPLLMHDIKHPEFSRSYVYDHAGRVTYNVFGYSSDIPYSQEIEYNAFSRMTSRATVYWEDENTANPTYTGPRENANTYDPAGNIIAVGDPEVYDGHPHPLYQFTTFDAASRRAVFKANHYYKTGSTTYASVYYSTHQYFDGDGHLAKTTREDAEEEVIGGLYQIWSSVLGSNLTDVDRTGKKITTKVFMGGNVIAEQLYDSVYDTETPIWIHADPMTGSTTRVSKSGAEGYRTEYETVGGQEVRTVSGTYPAQGNSADSMAGAGDPNWQCMMTEALANKMVLPTQCALAIAARGDVYMGKGGGLYPEKHVDTIEPKGTVAAGPHGPSGSEPPTEKPRVDSTSGGVVPDSSIPSADGQDDSSDEVSTHYGGVNDSSVTVRAAGSRGTLEMGPPGQDASQGGGGGLRQGRLDNRSKLPLAKPPTPAKMATCLKQFGNSVSLTGARSADGKMYTSIVQMGNQSFEVTTNFGRFSGAELGAKWAAANSEAYTGQVESGLTLANNPTSNDIAREVVEGTENREYSAVGFMALVYHELGVAIAGKLYADAFIRNRAQGKQGSSGLKDPFKSESRATDTGDKDSGVTFERCLFGGIVGLRDGRVGNSRAW